jgi:hypothetical protein
VLVRAASIFLWSEAMYRKPQPNLWSKLKQVWREMTVTRYSGPYYMTDGKRFWEYDKKRYRRKGEAYPIGSPTFRAWVSEHDRLIFYDETIGRAMIKLDYVRGYAYWRGYMWPMRRRKPVRVYVGKLESVSSDKLLSKMRELSQKYREKRRYYTIERERARKNRRRAAKHRWYVRYRNRRSTGKRQERFSQSY